MNGNLSETERLKQFRQRRVIGSLAAAKGAITVDKQTGGRSRQSQQLAGNDAKMVGHIDSPFDRGAVTREVDIGKERPGIGGRYRTLGEKWMGERNSGGGRERAHQELPARNWRQMNRHSTSLTSCRAGGKRKMCRCGWLFAEAELILGER